MDVPLRWLRAFAAVVEHSTFTRAAKALYTSQPVLSKQIRSLEEALRVEVFVRNRRGTRLSDAGRALLPGALATLHAWDDAQRTLESATAASATTITVGLHVGVERGLLPRVRERLAAQLPYLRLKLRQASWSDPSAGLLGPVEDRVDAAFIFLPLPPADAEHLSWHVLSVEPRRLLVSDQHRFADRQAVTLSELDEENFLALPSTAGPLREHFLGAPERTLSRVKVSETVGSPEEVFEAVAADLGVALVAAGNVETFRRAGVAAVDVLGLSPSTLALAWRSDDDRPLVHDLASAVRESAQNAPGLVN